MDSLYRAASLALTVFLLSLLVTIAGCEQSDEATAQFLNARQAVIEGRYADAIPALRAYLTDHPHGAHASRAGLFLGKAYLAQDELDIAQGVFEHTRDHYPNTLEAHKSRYKLAVIDLVRGEPRRAQSAFAELARRHDGPLAPEAAAMTRYLSR